MEIVPTWDVCSLKYESRLITILSTLFLYATITKDFVKKTIFLSESRSGDVTKQGSDRVKEWRIYAKVTDSNPNMF